jgi:AcrR family transcriptional regulator
MERNRLNDDRLGAGSGGATPGRSRCTIRPPLRATMEHDRLVVLSIRRMAGKRVAAGAAVLQEDVTVAITRAFFREWARVGFTSLSIESVAKRAGVGKAAVYRRWPSKVALASHLLHEVGVGLARVPDTGSLRGDVSAFLNAAHAALRRPLVRKILPDLHAEMGRSAPLAHAIRTSLQHDRRAMGEELLRRAIERGELDASLDTDLALDLLGGLIYWRMIVTGMKASDDYLERLKALTLGALLGMGGTKPT